MNTRTDRQLQIIDTAAQIITEKGVNALTTKYLSSRIGFSESALYRHFSSKESIIVSMLQHLAEIMEERFSQVQYSDEDPSNNLREFFSDQFKFFTEHKQYVVAVFSDDIFQKSEAVKEAIDQVMETKRKSLLPIITTGKQKMVFTNEVSSQDLMNIIMGAIRLQMYKWKNSGFEYDITIRGNHTVEALIQLITIKK
tara:strand:- start:64162 stop:64752 length:591 start_codon:yes stop_codon:yes gene_type:complete